MSEYIECRNCDSSYCNGCNVYTLSKMLHKGAFKRITNDHHSIIPVAEVEEVKHGRWKSVGLAGLRCSKCGHEDHWKMYYSYCPNCGADMRGGNDGEE